MHWRNSFAGIFFGTQEVDGATDSQKSAGMLGARSGSITEAWQEGDVRILTHTHTGIHQNGPEKQSSKTCWRSAGNQGMNLAIPLKETIGDGL